MGLAEEPFVAAMRTATPRSAEGMVLRPGNAVRDVTQKTKPQAAAHAESVGFLRDMMEELPEGTPEKANFAKIIAAGGPRSPSIASSGPQRGADHKMIESILRGHEWDELGAKPMTAFRGMGHMSPDVILREHNRVATLPKEYGAAGSFMKDLRAGREAISLGDYGVDYGNSPRLSRHARKRITEGLERQATGVAKLAKLEPRDPKLPPLQDHITFQGLKISIENKKGSIRKWYDPDGKERGRCTMHAHYGFIDGVEGADGEELDVYVGPHEDATEAYVIDQRKAPDFKVFDEQKCLLGFRSPAEAAALYNKQYNDTRFFGAMKAMPMAEFKAALKTKGAVRIKMSAALRALVVG
jgi:hypothetical protein